nr:SDR family oxidoreductase [Methanocella sp. CWC-04]
MLDKLGLSLGSLTGKVAVITGAGGGIGKELAIGLSMLGASVVIAEIGDSGAEAEKRIISMGGKALFVKTDVSDEKSVNELKEKSLRAFGKADIVVNNAVTVTTGSVMEQPVSAWDRVMAVNLKGPLLMIKAFLPAMIERKDGVIVNMLSSEGMAYLAPYSASKAALMSLTSSLVSELGDGTGVSVFNFAPGMVDTPAIHKFVPEVAPRMGLTFEQFTHLGVNPGYEGLMPAEDCAAGLAYAIVHAKEYHGQTADPFKPLMQTGMLENAPGNKQATAVTACVTAKTTASERAKELRNVIMTVNREFEELDLFKRTWAKNDFNRKAGMGINDWLKVSADLVNDLNELSCPDGADKAASIKGKFPYVISKLEKLADYFKGSIENAKGWFKDPKQRDIAVEALERRENAVKSLISSLKEL